MILSNSRIDNTIATLNFFEFLLLQDKAKPSGCSKDRPILILKTVKGERKLEVVHHRNSLSIFTRILAYFGFGEASLKNIRNYLYEHQVEIRKAKGIDLLKEIDLKIQKRNAHHYFKFIPSVFCLVQPLKIQESYEKSSTTYHPADSTLEQDQKGILDFCHVFADFGAAYVADGTGHGNPDKRKVINEIWNEFNKDFYSVYLKVIKDLDNERMFEFVLKTLILNLNEEFAKAGTSSTFSLAFLVQIREEKYLASIHVGDSKILHMTKDKIITDITQNHANQLELSSLDSNSSIFFDIRKVQSGDIIFGLTDGITDYLSSDVLHPLLSSSNSSNLIERLEKAIEGSNPEKADDKGYYNPTNKNRSDDISAFMMAVS